MIKETKPLCLKERGWTFVSICSIVSEVLLVPVQDGVGSLGHVPLVLLQDLERRVVVQLQPDALLVVDLVDEPHDLDGQVDVPPGQGQGRHADLTIHLTPNHLPDDSDLVKILAFA